MIYMSRDARRITDHLTSYGIDSDLKDRFDIEVACSQFLPNHIMGVVDQILKGKKSIDKLTRAQDRRWDYFNKPVYDILTRRHSAWQNIQLELDSIIPFAMDAYSIVTATLLPHDINRVETNLLIYEIPPLGNRDDILGAVRICKDRGARSVAYLHAILSRQRAKKLAEIEERKKSEIPVWKPGELERLEESLGVVEDWDDKKKLVDIDREFERHRNKRLKDIEWRE